METLDHDEGTIGADDLRGDNHGDDDGVYESGGRVAGHRMGAT